MLFTLVLVTGSLTDLEFTIEAKIDVSVFALSLQLPFFFFFFKCGFWGNQSHACRVSTLPTEPFPPQLPKVQ